MAIAFVQIDTHKRSLGHSVAAAIAYRTGLCLHDVRTGELHDYRPRETREEIADAAIVSSRPTPLAEDWQTLADATESRERHPRAWILRDVKVAIPHELSIEQKKRLARRISEMLAEYGDTVVGHALHPPSATGDERNWHTHHVMPTRSLTEDGLAFGDKLKQLDSKYQSPEEVAHLRNRIGDLINEALRDAGIDEEVYMGQRVDETARPRIPGEVVHMARRLTEERVRTEVAEMSASEVIDRAVKNGDVDRKSASAARFAGGRRCRRRAEKSHRGESKRSRVGTRRRNPRARRATAAQRVAPSQSVRRQDRVERRREKKTAEIVELARERTVQRLSPGRAAARDLVDQAVANGDVAGLFSDGQRHRGRGPRSPEQPRYRRRSRSWRQRRADEKRAKADELEEERTAPTTTHVDENGPVEREEGEPAPEGRKRRKGRRRARTSVEERRARRAERAPRPRRRGRSPSTPEPDQGERDTVEWTALPLPNERG